MVRIILSLLCCALSAAGAWAQSCFNPAQHGLVHSPSLPLIMAQQAWHTSSAATYKTTGSGQRLMALTTSLDSFCYAWGGNRELPHYTDPSFIQWYDAPYDPFFPMQNRPERNHRHNLIQADSIYHYNTGSGTNNLLEAYHFEYDADNRITLHNNYKAPYKAAYTNIIYGPHGLTVAERFMDTTLLQTGNFMLSDRLYSYYDAGGVLVKDSVMRYLESPGAGNFRLFLYQKDAMGRDTGMAELQATVGSTNFSTQSRFRYEYDASGMLSIGHYYYRYQNGPLQLFYVDSFGYSGSNPYPACYQQTSYNYPSSNPNDVWGIDRTYALFNANDDVQWKATLGFDMFNQNWDTTLIYYYHYNANHNPDSIIIKNFWVQKYYYEPTSIKDVAAKPVSIGLHPNPASQSITLSIPSFKAGTASIYDMQGRLVQTCGIVKNEQAIDISRLHTGIYLVQYSSDDGSVGTARFVRE